MTIITHNQIGLAVGDTNEEIEKATFTRVMLQVRKAMCANCESNISLFT